MRSAADPGAGGTAPARHRRIPRALIIAAAVLAAALYALLALASGLDRAAGPAAHPYPLALPPFAAGHHRARARNALIAGDPTGALAAARAAVRGDPTDADGLSLLAAAALAGGEGAYTRRAFAVAARLGWRDPATQAYWLHWQIERGDYHAAADHLDALLRQSPELATRNLLLAPFDATPGGRGELARRLSARPAWAVNYFADTAAPAAGLPLARAEVALLLARAGVRDCPLVAPLIAGLLGHDRYAEARAVRRAHCEAAAGDSALVTDGRFARADAAHPPTALDWHFTDDGAIDATLASDARIAGRAAIVANAGAVTLAFAEQPLMLPAGDYTIAWRARDTAGAPATASEVALTCATEAAPWLPKRLADGGAGFRADAVVPADCTRQRLVLGIAGGARDVAIGDIVLAPRRH